MMKNRESSAMAIEKGQDDSLSLYIHIPFCSSKCYYCDFCSDVYCEHDEEAYFVALQEEILSYQNLFANKVIRTIYIGGGTPTCVNTQHIVGILNIIHNICNLKSGFEITVEANPNSLSEEKLSAFLTAGVNRISLGIQSLSQEILDSIGRKQTIQKAVSALSLLNEKKVNFSVDIMLGLPFQTEKSILSDLKKILKFKPNHLSLYMLKVEERTPLFEMVQTKKISVPSDDLCVDFYQAAYSFLKKKGYHRYEVSNFAKIGFESRHNLNYWMHGEYLGLGLAAHSFLNGVRFSNTENFQDYVSLQMNRQYEELTPVQLREEKIMLALRTSYGLQDYAKLIDPNNIEDVKEYLVISPTHLSIKDDYFGVMNEIIVKLL